MKSLWPGAMPVIGLLILEFFIPLSQGGIWDLPVPRLVSWELELVFLGFLGGLSGYLGLWVSTPYQSKVPIWAWWAFLPLLGVTLLIPVPITRTLSELPLFVLMASGFLNGGLFVLQIRASRSPRDHAAAARFLSPLMLIIFGFCSGGEGKSGAAGVLVLVLSLLWVLLWILEDRRKGTWPADIAGKLVPEALVHYRISEREADVARLTAQGLTNQEISQGLFISLATVKSHMASLLNKTATKNRTQMVARLLNPPFGR